MEVVTMPILTNSDRDLSTITAEEVAQLASRLERDDYQNPFDGLNDWHLLRAIAFQKPELVEPYIHLLDIEAYDEA
jgi:type IV secretory pathway ATPase VirB11/archaellum biosynthesis ATPase